MSRIGQQPVKIPEGVTVRVDGFKVKVTGPNGELTQVLRSQIKVEIKDNQVILTRKNDEKFSKSLHGLYRSLISNMIKGVTEGWSKTLKLVGTGYRVKVEGEKIVLSLGFSHPVEFEPEAGVKFEVQGNETIVISGNDKGKVGEMAAKIRAVKPPEPYKGKGIRYEDEQVRRKPGKAAKVGDGFAAGS